MHSWNRERLSPLFTRRFFHQRQRKVAAKHAVGEAPLLQFFSFSTRRLLARAGAIAGTIVLAACEPAEPPVVAASEERPAALVPAPPPKRVAEADATLGRLIEGAPKWVVAGERSNVELLRRFYAGHGFAPVWTDREAQAKSLIDAVLHARDHGLAPELFHADLLRSSATLPTLERDLLLSTAFLSYADALARGAMPIERRKDEEALAPEPIDVVAALDAAIGSPDPAAAIEALAPTTPTYRLLREALQKSRTGIAAGGKSALSRRREIEVNLERERWLPRRLPSDRVWVNVADQRLVLYRDDRPVFSTRVIVGQDGKRNQSPEFQGSIDHIWFNPPWTIPDDIARDEILPKARSDPDYLERHNLTLLPDGRLQQRAGPQSALGHLLFEMNNRFDVYLHDTPSKSLFDREDRRFSHGCIRVEDPRKLAALLMQQPSDAIDDTISAGATVRRDLPKPVSVFVVYETAFADSNDTLQFRPDIYGRDAEIWQYLQPKGRATAARR